MSAACLQKFTLLKTYDAAVERYSQAVAALGQAAGAVIYSEYELVKRKVDASRKASEEARERLEQHVRAHDC